MNINITAIWKNVPLAGGRGKRTIKKLTFFASFLFDFLKYILRKKKVFEISFHFFFGMGEENKRTKHSL